MTIKRTTYKPVRSIEVVDAPAPAKKPRTKLSTLDDIEEKMIDLAAVDSNDPMLVMMNEKKIAMLEKVANFKLRRLQLQELEKQNVVTTAEPLEVKFITSKQTDQNIRLDNIDKDILERRVNKQDA